MNAITLSADSAGGQMTTTLITFVLIILIFYFLIIRPQKKRDKEAKLMLEAMKKGDKVISIGGIHGTVVAVREHTVLVKVDDNTRLEFNKSAISSVISKDKAVPQSAKKKAKEEEAAEKKAEGPELEIVEPETAGEKASEEAPAEEEKE